MICVKIKGFKRECLPISGGISRVYLFDPDDFNWTQDPVIKSYTAVERRAGADVAPNLGLFYKIDFQSKTAELKSTRAVGASGGGKYTQQLEGVISGVSQESALFLTSLDAASYCCGIGVIVEDNNGRTFVWGEKYVNQDVIPDFRVEHANSESTSGKLFEELNGTTLRLSSDYSRPLFEFSGGISAIIDMSDEKAVA